MRARTLGLALVLLLVLAFVFARAAAAAPNDADPDELDEDSDEEGRGGHRGNPGDRRDRDDDRHRGDDAALDLDDERGGPPAPSARLAAPTIARVLALADRAAGLDRQLSRGWIRRARLSGLVPWVAVRAGRNTSWQELDPDVDRGATIEVRATWRLDRLLFDGRELQVASIEAARRRERRRLAAQVIRAYFEWRRAAAAAATSPRWAERAREAAAVLDALTDGGFTAERTQRRGRRVRKPDTAPP